MGGVGMNGLLTCRSQAALDPDLLALQYEHKCQSVYPYVLACIPICTCRCRCDGYHWPGISRRSSCVILVGSDRIIAALAGQNNL